MDLRMICGAVLLLTSSATATCSSEKSDFDAAALFRSNCASCHGFTGKGDGPVSAILSVKPAPLETLSDRHNGAFPYDYVYGVIDGRLAVRAHGSRDMPVWGKLFSRAHEGGTIGDEATSRSTELMIRALVDYIRNLQQ